MAYDSSETSTQWDKDSPLETNIQTLTTNVFPNIPENYLKSLAI